MISNFCSQKEDYTFESITNAVKNITNQDKQIQTCAHHYLEQFVFEAKINIGVITKMMEKRENTIQFFGINLLCRNILNRVEEIPSEEISELSYFVSHFENIFIENRLIYRELLKCLAILIVNKLEKGEVVFFENFPGKNVRENKQYLIVLYHIGEFLKNSLLPGPLTIRVKSKINEFSSKLSVQISILFETNELLDFCLDAMEAVSSRIEFLDNPEFIWKIGKLLQNAIQTDNRRLVQKIKNGLTEIISNSKYADFLKISTLDGFVRDYGRTLLSIENISLENLLEISGDKDQIVKLNLSVLILASFFQIFPLCSIVDFSEFFCCLFQNFPQYLFFTSNLCNHLFGIINSFIEFQNLTKNLMFNGFSWIHIFLKYATREATNLEPSLVQRIQLVVLKLANVGLGLNSLKNQAEVDSFVQFYVNKNQSSDEILQFQEDRAYFEDFFADMVMNWKSINPELFYFYLQTLLEGYLKGEREGQHFALKLESFLFFIRSIQASLLEDPVGLKILQNSLKIIFANFSEMPSFLSLSILLFANNFSYENSNDEELTLELVKYCANVMIKGNLPEFEKLTTDTFCNLLANYKGGLIKCQDMRQISSVIFQKCASICVTKTTMNNLQSKCQLIQSLVSSFLKHVNKNFYLEKNDYELLLKFFFDKVELEFCRFKIIENDPSNFLFLTFLKSMLEAYELEKDLCEINEFDILFTDMIFQFIKKFREPIFEQFEFWISCSSYKSLYLNLLQGIIKNFSDSDLGYFDILFPKFVTLENQEILKISLLDLILLMNFEDQKNCSTIVSNLSLIDEGMLKHIHFQENEVVLTKSEDFETEFVSFQSTLMTHCSNFFFGSLNFEPKMKIILLVFRKAKSIVLKKEGIRFLSLKKKLRSRLFR